jgi:hypothetical protein
MTRVGLGSVVIVSAHANEHGLECPGGCNLNGRLQRINVGENFVVVMALSLCFLPCANNPALHSISWAESRTGVARW